MRTAASALAETATKVTNDEVAALLPSLQDMYRQVADVMEAISRGDVSKVEDLSALGEQFQATSAAFQEVCSP